MEALSPRIHPDDRGRVLEIGTEQRRQGAEQGGYFRAFLRMEPTKHIHSEGNPCFDDVPNHVSECSATSIDVTSDKTRRREREKLRQAQADLAQVSRVTRWESFCLPGARPRNKTKIAAAIPTPTHAFVAGSRIT